MISDAYHRKGNGVSRRPTKSADSWQGKEKEKEEKLKRENDHTAHMMTAILLGSLVVECLARRTFRHCRTMSPPRRRRVPH